MDLFRKKSVDQLVAESTPLKRTMRTFDLTMLGIGAKMHLVAPKSIVRSEGKAVRVIDKRHLHD